MNSNAAYAFRLTQLRELKKHWPMKQTTPDDTQTLQMIFGRSDGGWHPRPRPRQAEARLEGRTVWESGL